MSDLSDIMGLPKPIERHTVSMDTTKRQTDERSDIPDTFKQKSTKQVLGGEISRERKSWMKFLEVCSILKKKNGVNMSIRTVDIVQRLQGTELFSLLENSMEGASQRIAALLDKSLSIETDFSSSDLRKNDGDDFDIGEFV